MLEVDNMSILAITMWFDDVPEHLYREAEMEYEMMNIVGIWNIGSHLVNHQVVVI